MQKKKWTYVIYTNKPGYVYVGESSNLIRRWKQHAKGKGAVFTKQFGVDRCYHVVGMTEKETCMAIKKTHPDWKVCGWFWCYGPEYTPKGDNPPFKLLPFSKGGV